MSETIVAGKRAVTEAIRSGAVTEVLVARSARTSPGVRDVLAAAERGRVTVREVERRELDALAADHRGVAARVGPDAGVTMWSERELATHDFADDDFVVVLDGVEDPQNLGAAARSAEAAGAAAIVTRVHRAAPVTPAAIRASAGALAHLPVARVANIARALGRLRDAGFTIVGLDGDAPGSITDEPCPDGRVAIVIGSEGAGMSRLVRETCDLLVSLPLRGRVASLNASASLAAALYAYVLPTRQRPDEA